MTDLNDGYDDDEDDELKAVMAISLLDQHRRPLETTRSSDDARGNLSDDRVRPQSVTVDVVDLTQGSDGPNLDDDMIASEEINHASLAVQEKEQDDGGVEGLSKSPTPPGSPAQITSQQRQPNTTISSFLSLDRKKMEEERLARRKRKASISPPRLKRDKRADRGGAEGSSETTDTANREGNTKLTFTSLSYGPPAQQQQQQDSMQISKHSPSTKPGLEYPEGTIKKTWAFGYPRDEDIKIEEVLQKNTLTTAVLSAFQWDVEWLLRKLDLSKTKMIFVMQAKDEATVGGIP